MAGSDEERQEPIAGSHGERGEGVSRQPHIDTGAAEHTTQLFIIHGRVQGVGFRAATRREAQRLGIEANPVNLADGTVEVTAAGPAAAIEALQRWLRHGPPHARVTAVDRAGPG